VRTGTSAIWEVRLPEVRRGVAQHLVLLLEQTDSLSRFPQLGQLAACLEGLRLVAGLGQPVVQRRLDDLRGPLRCP